MKSWLEVELQRYYTDKTIKALEALGFVVRNTDNSTVVYCFHTITKKEIWIPKTPDGVLSDVIEFYCGRINLPIHFFVSVYQHVAVDNQHPSDQH